MLKPWQVPAIWEGGEVWILGGGPSVIDCFNIPLDIVNDVKSKRIGLEAYSPYLAAIHNKHVIGINVAYKLGSWVDICFFGDKPFYLTHKNGLAKFPNLIVTCAEFVGNKELSWIKYLEQEQRQNCKAVLRKTGISSKHTAVRWNNNSGASAISLARWLGAKKIILVGFDMKLGTDKAKHFHNEYAIKEDRKKRPRQKRKPIGLPFNVHLRGFPTIKEDADALGIEIINTSLDSAIEVFPKVNIKELL